MIKTQKGFTLIELMVSITLGSLVSAAAISLYLSAQKNYGFQDAYFSSLNTSSKGMLYLADQVKKAGYGQSQSMLTSTTPKSNIVNGATNYKYSFTVNRNYISGYETGSSYMTKPSDQLVIKYTPLSTNGYDCEGNKIANTTTQIVERYFVRKSDNGESLSLACDAGRYHDSVGLSSMGGDGAELIPNVDFFHVMYTVADSSAVKATQFRDVNISQYKTMTGMKIVGVKLGLITHSDKSIGYKPSGMLNNEITVFNKKVKFNSSVIEAKEKYWYNITMRTVSLSDGAAPVE